MVVYQLSQSVYYRCANFAGIFLKVQPFRNLSHFHSSNRAVVGVSSPRYVLAVGSQTPMGYSSILLVSIEVEQYRTFRVLTQRITNRFVARNDSFRSDLNTRQSHLEYRRRLP